MPGGSYKTAKPLPVRSTAVIGAGTMGSGIAVCLLSAGLPVYLLEQNEKVRCIPTLYTCVSIGVELEGKTYGVERKGKMYTSPTLYTCVSTGVELGGKTCTFFVHLCIYWSRMEK